ncbi:hypothetical protein A2223_00110 [Candidatus Falkowbacteria bacterium RIFOXYA2_FULL_35_8]|nr:MAG: hypothetical protein A2223_00110 [Candidatus Falkowbacteria bacterium RIFOXYA2_FULL_35_8]
MYIISMLAVISCFIVVTSWSATKLNNLDGVSPLSRKNKLSPYRHLFRIICLVFCGALFTSSLYIEFGPSVLKQDSSGHLVLGTGSTFCHNDCINLPTIYKFDNYVPLNGCVLRITASAQVSEANIRQLAEQFQLTNRSSPQSVEESYTILRGKFYLSVNDTELMLQSLFTQTGCEQLELYSIPILVQHYLNARLNLFGYELSSLPQISWE